MKELFGRRPKDLSENQIDSIQSETALDKSIMGSTDLKPLKKPKTPLTNLLDKNFDEQPKYFTQEATALMKHSKELVERQTDAQRGDRRQSITWMGEILD